MNENLMKITYTKNLAKTNFSSTLSVAIDSNVNIKTILNTHAYLFDEKIECGNGKAILTGRIGLKVLYIDTDGITNTITDSQAISENITDAAITADSFISVNSITVVPNILSNNGVLKVVCEVSLVPSLYFNLPLTNKTLDIENVVNKKSEIEASSISSFVNTNFNYTTNFETKYNISKILCHDAYFTPTNISAKNESIYVEGKIYSRLLFETTQGDETKRMELTDVFNLTQEVAVAEINDNNLLDLNFALDKSKEQITTDFEDDNSVVTITNHIKVCGVALTNINVELVDDAFSTNNELELSFAEREFIMLSNTQTFNDNIYGEISLTDNEPAIEEVISNLNITPEITNTYIKNGTLHLEGVISSYLCHIDENKQCLNKKLELPFVLNSKLELENANNSHAHLHVEDCKIKIKRGTIIEVEYLVKISIKTYSSQRKQMVDNIKFGNPLNFSGYDYQIYLAKPNETTWELCKRIKITPEKLTEINKDLPLVMNGGEKIIIKR